MAGIALTDVFAGDRFTGYSASGIVFNGFFNL